MATVVTKAAEIASCQKQLTKLMYDALPERYRRIVSYPSGETFGQLRWSPDLGIWIRIGRLANRYWNALGTMSPEVNDRLDITCEVNPPLGGTNRRVSGVFFRDEQTGDIGVGHRGRIGGGREGIGKSLFFRAFRGDFFDVQDHDRVSRIAFIGSLDSIDFPKQLASFVKEVDRIKRSISKSSPTEPSGGFSPEFEGERNEYVIPSPIRAVVVHGKIVNQLTDRIKELGYCADKDQARDLFIIGRKGQLLCLFEVKPDGSSSYVYSAIGQLKYHSLGFPNARLIAVLPKATDQRIISKLNALQIETLRFTIEKGRVHFHYLANKLRRLS